MAATSSTVYPRRASSPTAANEGLGAAEAASGARKARGARAAGATCTQGRHATYHTYGHKSTVFHLKVPIAGIHVIIFAYQSGVDTRESCSLRLRVAFPASAVTFPRAELVADSATGRDLLPPNKRTSNFHRWHARLGGAPMALVLLRVASARHSPRVRSRLPED